MQISPERTVELIGPCTDDIRDCEIMRAAIVQQDTDLSNEKSQEIRVELAKVACGERKRAFLADIKL